MELVRAYMEIVVKDRILKKQNGSSRIVDQYFKGDSLRAAIREYLNWEQRMLIQRLRPNYTGDHAFVSEIIHPVSTDSDSYEETVETSPVLESIVDRAKERKRKKEKKEVQDAKKKMEFMGQFFSYSSLLFFVVAVSIVAVNVSRVEKISYAFMLIPYPLLIWSVLLFARSTGEYRRISKKNKTSL